MPSVKVYNQQGAVIREEVLDDAVFGVRPNATLLHDVVVSLQANLRLGTAHTKTKGEVRGGGKKPWKQKGTGRARHGSSRSPLWKGGGVTFGPRNDRNYTQKINKKVRQLALRMCLSDKVASDRLMLVETLALPTQKTKAAQQLLKTLQIPLQKKNAVLVVSPSGAADISRCVRNLTSAYVLHANNLNILDVLKFPYLVTTPEEAKNIERLYKEKKT